MARRHGRDDAELEACVGLRMQCRLAARQIGRALRHRQVLLHQPAEVGEVREVAFAAEQLSAQLLFERVDGAGQ
jgi:hypothetical protein